MTILKTNRLILRNWLEEDLVPFSAAFTPAVEIGRHHDPKDNFD